MSAVYTVFTSPNHAPIPNHLPTLIVTPHGQPTNILYSYLHTNFNAENYLLTPSPQGDLCVAKLFPPSRNQRGAATQSDPGHGTSSTSRSVRCEASRNLKWTITNTGVLQPIYKLSLPAQDQTDLPLFQISKPNPNATFWSMFYFAYAGHLIPPKRIEFGKIQKNPPGSGGGGTRISITGKTAEEKAVWQTLGEGNEDCVEWVVLCAALNLLDDEIIKAAEKAAAASVPAITANAPRPMAQPVQGQPQTRPDPRQQMPPPPNPRVGSAPPPQNGRPVPQSQQLRAPGPNVLTRPQSANAVQPNGQVPPRQMPVQQRPATSNAAGYPPQQPPPAQGGQRPPQQQQAGSHHHNVLTKYPRRI